MEMRRYHWNVAASVRFEVLAAVLPKIQVFWDVMLTTDWQTEIDIPKVGSAFILKFMQQKKHEIVGVLENSAVKTVLHEDGADERRNASEY